MSSPPTHHPEKKTEMGMPRKMTRYRRRHHPKPYFDFAAAAERTPQKRHRSEEQVALQPYLNRHWEMTMRSLGWDEVAGAIPGRDIGICFRCAAHGILSKTIVGRRRNRCIRISSGRICQRGFASADKRISDGFGRITGSRNCACRSAGIHVLADDRRHAALPRRNSGSSIVRKIPRSLFNIPITGDRFRIFGKQSAITRFGVD